MSETNTDWTDRIFFLPPSFWAILAGAWIGAAINILTGLVFSKDKSSTCVILSIIFLLSSSSSFVYIFLNIEDAHLKAKDIHNKLDMIRDRKKKLLPAFRIGVECTTISIILLLYAMAN